MAWTLLYYLLLLADLTLIRVCWRVLQQETYRFTSEYLRSLGLGNTVILTNNYFLLTLSG